MQINDSLSVKQGFKKSPTEETSLNDNLNKKTSFHIKLIA